MPLRIPLNSPTLFGNEAAEDEPNDIFQSILVDREEAATFADRTRRLLVVTAYKGEGKSALLRTLRARIEADETCVVVSTTGPAAQPAISGTNSATWSRAWKKALFSLVAGKVGARVGRAWSDDTMALVEEAEAQGFRERSFFSAIFDRLSPTISLGTEAAGVNLQRLRQGPPNIEATLQRVDATSLAEIWIVMDDLDRNFRNTKEERAKIAGFFDAAREMCNSVPQLRIRASIRPNVYATVRLQYESLSHIRQYLVPMAWSEQDIRAMLARRVEGFLFRSGQLHNVKLDSGPRRPDQLIALVFETPVQWGQSQRPIQVPIYTLSAHRPRWVVELCKVAGRRAHSARGAVITLRDITAEMGEFGSNRRADLVAEFRPQCPQLAELIDAFDGQSEEYSTKELFEVIDSRILSRMSPQIAGVNGSPKAAEIASYLFEAGLFFGRRDLPNGEYQHVGFAQKPGLLTSRTNPDDELRWEIHPVFRQALRMRDSTGQIR